MAVLTAPESSNLAYYDAFSATYEHGRDSPYHLMLDDMEVDLTVRYGQGKRILEIGCGTGRILGRTAAAGAPAIGADISHGMLVHAARRGLPVVQADATALPFADHSFDLVCSFKVLAHVAEVASAMAEIDRVLAPGGHAILEFYNPRSLRGVIKRFKRPTRISEATADHDVFTRLDTPEEIRGYLPAGYRVVAERGIRVLTPVAQAHAVPVLGAVLRRLEWRAADSALWRRFGGFYAVVARKPTG